MAHFILFERLGLPAGKKTTTGQSSTAEDVLQELAEDYPLPRVLLEHRGLIWRIDAALNQA